MRYLLERVSWYCRDHRSARDSGDGSAELVFSNRSGMSYDDLKTYLRLLQEKTGFFDVRIEWSVIKPGRITAYMPGKRMGLQIADAIAGSFYYAVQPSKHGFTEERYALALKPVVYSRRERYLGYGLKFWPREVDHLLRTEEHLRWVESSYK